MLRPDSQKFSGNEESQREQMLKWNEQKLGRLQSFSVASESEMESSQFSKLPALKKKNLMRK